MKEYRYWLDVVVSIGLFIAVPALALTIIQSFAVIATTGMGNKKGHPDPMEERCDSVKKWRKGILYASITAVSLIPLLIFIARMNGYSKRKILHGLPGLTRLIFRKKPRGLRIRRR